MKIKKTGKEKRAGDIPLLICVFLMVGFGCLMIYSASSYVGQVQYGDKLFFVKKQLIGVAVGALAFLGVQFIPYQKLAKLKIAAVVVAVILLALVFVPGVGVTNYGATRWIGFGSFTLQPSEIAKYAFVIFAAAYFSKNYLKVKTFLGVLPVLLVGVIFCLLIIAEPNMSITMCVGLLMLAMIFLSGTNLKNCFSALYCRRSRTHYPRTLQVAEIERVYRPVGFAQGRRLSAYTVVVRAR